MIYDPVKAQENVDLAAAFLREAEFEIPEGATLVNAAEWEQFKRAMNILIVNRPSHVDFWLPVPEKIFAMQDGTVVGQAPGSAPNVVG